MDEVFNRLTPELPEGERPDFLSAIDAIIARKSGDYVVEHCMSESPTPIPVNRFHMPCHYLVSAVLFLSGKFLSEEVNKNTPIVI